MFQSRDKSSKIYKGRNRVSIAVCDPLQIGVSAYHVLRRPHASAREEASVSAFTFASTAYAYYVQSARSRSLAEEAREGEGEGEGGRYKSDPVPDARRSSHLEVNLTAA